MPYYQFLWNDDLIDHIGQHGISQDEFEQIVCNPDSKGYSRSSDRPAAWGYTDDGRYMMAVFEELDDFTILPVTAYEVPEPN